MSFSRTGAGLCIYHLLAWSNLILLLLFLLFVCLLFYLFELAFYFLFQSTLKNLFSQNICSNNIKCVYRLNFVVIYLIVDKNSLFSSFSYHLFNLIIKCSAFFNQIRQFIPRIYHSISKIIHLAGRLILEICLDYKFPLRGTILKNGLPLEFYYFKIFN